MISVEMSKLDTSGFSDDLLAEVRKNAPRAVAAGRRVVVAEMRRLLTLRSGGPAPPGQPPAKVEGELLRSIKLPAVKRKPWGAEAAIHVDHPGANRLEYGARDVRGIATHPHPYAAPALASKQAEADRAMEAAL